VARLVAPVVVGFGGGVFATLVRKGFERRPYFPSEIVVPFISQRHLAEGLAIGLLVPAICILLWDQTRARADDEDHSSRARTIVNVLLGSLGASVPMVFVWLYFSDERSPEPGLLGLVPVSARLAATVGLISFFALQARWALWPRPPVRLDRPLACAGTALVTYVIACVLAGVEAGRLASLSWL